MNGRGPTRPLRMIVGALLLGGVCLFVAPPGRADERLPPGLRADISDPTGPACHRGVLPDLRAQSKADLCATLLRCCFVDQVSWCCDRVDRYCS
jgi:hypothetical protein